MAERQGWMRRLVLGSGKAFSLFPALLSYFPLLMNARNSCLPGTSCSTTSSSSSLALNSRGTAPVYSASRKCLLFNVKGETANVAVNYDSDRVAEKVGSHNIWKQPGVSGNAYQVRFRLIEARKVPPKKGFWFVAKMKSSIDSSVREEWGTELSFNTSKLVFSSSPCTVSVRSLAGLYLTIQFWTMRKVPILLGEVSAAVDLFPVNHVSSQEIAIFKSTIAVLQLQISSFKLLPNPSYSAFTLSLLANNMKLVRGLIAGMKEKSQLIPLLRVLLSIDVADNLIDYALCKEVQSCDSIQSLFRQDSKNIFVLDTYIHMVGQEYLLSVLRPFVAQIIKDQPNCETEGVSKEDLKHNIQTIKNAMLRLVDVISSSDDQCSPLLQAVLTKLYSFAMARWPYDAPGWVTAVTGFLFLRFFVPSLLDPCEYLLCRPWELRFQERQTLFKLSIVLQKMSNMVLFRQAANNFHLLNPGVQLGSFTINQWVTAMCNIDTKTQHRRAHQLGNMKPKLGETLAFNAGLLAKYYVQNNNCSLIDNSDKTEYAQFVELALEVVHVRPSVIA
eukprot:TRINITY_DN2199_c0_g1_i1.p1 TRINITY_DN2199_c0_g1~~TRINITY_DN2199_c0_g1_i1.p1  ORF type:complete len:558 (+),score=69.11 TRINITY_DN2199_c0_g1_i1:272-1945(+)